MTEEENTIYNNIMKDVYSVFREEVKKRRNLSEDIMEEIATGLVFSAEQAKKNGLIDGIANLETVVDELKAKTGFLLDIFIN